MIHRRSLLALLLAVSCSLCMVDRVHPANGKEPYKIRIVVQVAKHRMLTKLYHDQVAQEINDGLQAALGDLAKVEVTTRPPSKWQGRSAYKTHFVQIDLSGTAYTIQTRQHDGLTGLPSPVMRRDRTRDRAYVARTAALLIEQDLGLMGTIDSEPDDKNMVKVSLKGGDLGVDLGKWVKKGEVFALVRVSGDAVGQWVPWAVLQVEEPAKDGLCVCRYYSRYRLPRVSGLKCVLLGTRKGPLRLRLVQERGGKLVKLDGGVSLQIRRHGFEGEDATRLDKTPTGKDVDTTRDGDNGQFNKLAFISVLSGDTLRARIPVPLIDDGLVVLPVPVGGEEGNLIAFRVRALKNNVIDSYRVQIDLFEEINKRTAKPEDRAEALKTVRTTLERSRQDHERLTIERDEVIKAIRALDAKDRPARAEMDAVEARLKLIKSGESDLMKHLTLLEKIEKEESDPKKREWLIQMERAKVLEKEAELGQALEIYEKAPPEFLTAGLKKKIASLKALWKAQNEKHQQARDFIYKTWPTLESASSIAERIDEARTALGECKKVADVVGPAKLLKSTEKHVERVAKELDGLKPDINIDDEKPAKVIKELIPKLRDLLAKTQEYLERSKKD